MTWETPTKAQAIEVLVRYRKSMTKIHIAEALLASADRASELNADLKWLVDEERLIQNSDGSYRPGKPGPSSLNANKHLKP